MPGKEVRKAGGKEQRSSCRYLDRDSFLCYFMAVYKFHISFSGEAVVAAEREPGENPGRSGHCKRGAMCKMPLYAVHARRRTGA